ncbi:MAG: hypothetical protein ABI282_04430 [Candidatus Baltobacteraceae bacterium]
MSEDRQSVGGGRARKGIEPANHQNGKPNWYLGAPKYYAKA